METRGDLDPRNGTVATAVTARNLHVMRKKTEVLHGLDLDVLGGRVTGLLGPSGSGKSTLLRAIVGVQKGVTGELSALGHPAGSGPLRTRVAYMTQAPSVYGDITVEENVRYFASLLSAGDRVDGAIETVDMQSLRHRTVSSLSGGERARVSLAAALVGDPELLVLDEPTVGLDPLLRFSLWETFHAIAQRGAALIVSSHVMDEAASCDDLLLLRDGAVLASGTPDEIRASAGVTDLSEAFLVLIRRLTGVPA